jgi:hypothetical protein
LRASPPDIERRWICGLSFSPGARRKASVRPSGDQRVARAGGQATRLSPARRRDAPEARVVAILLLVDRDQHVSSLTPIRRDLRVRDPLELQKVGFGDGSALGGTRQTAKKGQGSAQQ